MKAISHSEKALKRILLVPVAWSDVKKKLRGLFPPRLELEIWANPENLFSTGVEGREITAVRKRNQFWCRNRK